MQPEQHITKTPMAYIVTRQYIEKQNWATDAFYQNAEPAKMFTSFASAVECSRLMEEEYKKQWGDTECRWIVISVYEGEEFYLCETIKKPEKDLKQEQIWPEVEVGQGDW